MADVFFFLELIENLKNTLRRGWGLRKVPSPESVSDHMYRMAVMCLLIHGFDDKTRTHAVYMALIHDMGEALVGDITPSDGISSDEKYLREEMAFKFLACTLRSSYPAFASSMLDLWYEYEKGESPAAILVRQVDKLECMHQAVIYEERDGINLEEFMLLSEKVTLPQLGPLRDACLQKHKELTDGPYNNVQIIFVSGGPGVGKGTQCALLAKEFGFHHISVGDLLREEARCPESPYRDFIPESIKKSVLLPAQLTTQLLRREMSRAQACGKNVFLLDGFPRNIAQAVDFESKICKNHVTLSLECSDVELEQRLQHRSRSSDRVDDNPESIKRRLSTFTENNAEVLEYLQAHGRVYRVKCCGSIDEVYSSVRPKIQEIILGLDKSNFA